MMPLKIEVIENLGSGYDITVLGIGEHGKKAIREYPCPAYGDNHWAIQTLTLCDDDAFQHKRYPKITTPRDSPVYLAQCRNQICEAIKNAEILFVVADISKDPDYENAFRFANLHRTGNREEKINVLIDCGEGHSFAELELSTIFDLVISNGTEIKPYRPAEMLLSDMYTQVCGLDFADVRAILNRTPKLNFLEFKIQEYEQLDKISQHIIDEVNKKKWKNDVFNALLYISFPHQSELDWYEVAGSLFDADIFGEMMFQIGFNRSEDDANVYISLLYGRERIKEKNSEDELDINKELLTEF